MLGPATLVGGRVTTSLLDTPNDTGDPYADAYAKAQAAYSKGAGVPTPPAPVMPDAPSVAQQMKQQKLASVRPGPPAPAPQPGDNPLSMEEQEEVKSLGRQAGDLAIGALGAVGNLFDLPASSVRDVLTWAPGGIPMQNPIDQWYPWNWFSGENRVTGEEMLESGGFYEKGPNPDRGMLTNIGRFAGGIGLELALDPLTYFGPGLLGKGIKATSKAARAITRAGMKDVAPIVATRKAQSAALDAIKKNADNLTDAEIAQAEKGVQDIVVGKNEAYVGTTPRDIIDWTDEVNPDLRDEIRKLNRDKLRQHAGDITDEQFEELLDTPLSEGVISLRLPFVDLYTDKVTKQFFGKDSKLPRALDKASETLQFGKIPGLGIAPVATARASFNKTTDGAKSKQVQLSLLANKKRKEQSLALARQRMLKPIVRVTERLDKVEDVVERTELSNLMLEYLEDIGRASEPVYKLDAAGEATNEIIGREFTQSLEDYARASKFDPIRSVLPDLNESKDLLKEVLDNAPDEGVDLSMLQDSMASYFPRVRQTSQGAFRTAADTKVYEPETPFAVKRDDVYRNLPGGTAFLQRLSVSKYAGAFDKKLLGRKKSQEDIDILYEKFKEGEQLSMNPALNDEMKAYLDEIPDGKKRALFDKIVALPAGDAKRHVTMFNSNPSTSALKALEAAYGASADAKAYQRLIGKVAKRNKIGPHQERFERSGRRHFGPNPDDNMTDTGIEAMRDIVRQLAQRTGQRVEDIYKRMNIDAQAPPSNGASPGGGSTPPGGASPSGGSTPPAGAAPDGGSSPSGGGSTPTGDGGGGSGVSPPTPSTPKGYFGKYTEDASDQWGSDVDGYFAPAGGEKVRVRVEDDVIESGNATASADQTYEVELYHPAENKLTVKTGEGEYVDIGAGDWDGQLKKPEPFADDFVTVPDMDAYDQAIQKAEGELEDFDLGILGDELERLQAEHMDGDAFGRSDTPDQVYERWEELTARREGLEKEVEKLKSQRQKVADLNENTQGSSSTVTAGGATKAAAKASPDEEAAYSTAKREESLRELEEQYGDYPPPTEEGQRAAARMDELREELGVRDEFVGDVDPPPAMSFADADKKLVAELGYSPADVGKLHPDVVFDLAKQGVRRSDLPAINRGSRGGLMGAAKQKLDELDELSPQAAARRESDLSIERAALRGRQKNNKYVDLADPNNPVEYTQSQIDAYETRKKNAQEANPDAFREYQLDLFEQASEDNQRIDEILSPGEGADEVPTAGRMSPEESAELAGKTDGIAEVMQKLNRGEISQDQAQGLVDAITNPQPTRLASSTAEPAGLIDNIAESSGPTDNQLRNIEQEGGLIDSTSTQPQAARTQPASGITESILKNENAKAGDQPGLIDGLGTRKQSTSNFKDQGSAKQSQMFGDLDVGQDQMDFFGEEGLDPALVHSANRKEAQELAGEVAPETLKRTDDLSEVAINYKKAMDSDQQLTSSLTDTVTAEQTSAINRSGQALQAAQKEYEDAMLKLINKEYIGKLPKNVDLKTPAKAEDSLLSELIENGVAFKGAKAVKQYLNKRAKDFVKDVETGKQPPKATKQNQMMLRRTAVQDAASDMSQMLHEQAQGRPISNSDIVQKKFDKAVKGLITERLKELGVADPSRVAERFTQRMGRFFSGGQLGDNARVDYQTRLRALRDGLKDKPDEYLLNLLHRDMAYESLESLTRKTKLETAATRSIKAGNLTPLATAVARHVDGFVVRRSATGFGGSATATSISDTLDTSASVQQKISSSMAMAGVASGKSFRENAIDLLNAKIMEEITAFEKHWKSSGSKNNVDFGFGVNIIVRKNIEDFVNGIPTKRRQPSVEKLVYGKTESQMDKLIDKIYSKYENPATAAARRGDTKALDSLRQNYEVEKQRLLIALKNHSNVAKKGGKTSGSVDLTVVTEIENQMQRVLEAKDKLTRRLLDTQQLRNAAEKAGVGESVASLAESIAMKSANPKHTTRLIKDVVDDLHKSTVKKRNAAKADAPVKKAREPRTDSAKIRKALEGRDKFPNNADGRARLHQIKEAAEEIIQQRELERGYDARRINEIFNQLFPNIVRTSNVKNPESTLTKARRYAKKAEAVGDDLDGSDIAAPDEIITGYNEADDGMLAELASFAGVEAQLGGKSDKEVIILAALRKPAPEPVRLTDEIIEEAYDEVQFRDAEVEPDTSFNFGANVDTDDDSLFKRVKTEDGEIEVARVTGLPDSWRDENVQVLIEAMSQADSTALVHEFGHVFRSMLNEIDPDLEKEAQALFGIPSGDWSTEITRNGVKQSAEEHFAEAWEAWAAGGGRAPVGMGTYFRRFKEFVADLYSQFTGTEVEKIIDPEIKKFFDKVVGPAAPAVKPTNLWDSMRGSKYSGENARRAILRVLDPDEVDAAKDSIQVERLNAYNRDKDVKLTLEDIEEQIEMRDLDPDAEIDPDIEKLLAEPTDEEVLSSFTIPEEVGKDLVNIVRKTEPEQLDGLAKSGVWLIDNFTSLFKTHVTATNPGFHGRNLLSGAAQNYMNGVVDTSTKNPIKRITNVYKDAWTVMQGKEIKGLAKRVPMFKGMTDKEATEKLIELVFSHAVLDSPGQHRDLVGTISGSVLDEIPGRVKMKEGKLGVIDYIMKQSKQKYPGLSPTPQQKLVDGYRRFIDASRTTGDVIETGHRMGGFIALLKQGYDPAEAATRVKLLHVDYGNLSKFEKTIMRRAFPFYSYTRGMSEYVAKEMTTNPAGPVGISIRAANRGRDRNVTTPDYVAEGLSIPLAAGRDGTQNFLTGLGLMHEQPVQLASPFLSGNMQGSTFKLMSQLNPLAKGIIELGTNESLFQSSPEGGRSLDDLDPLLGRTLSNIGNTLGLTDRTTPVPTNKNFELLLSNSPASRYMSTARQLFDPRKTLFQKGLNLGTGVRVSSISPGAQDAVLRERATKIMRDMGGKIFDRSYIPKDELERMTPEERKQAERWMNLMNLLAKRAKKRKQDREQVGAEGG